MTRPPLLDLHLVTTAAFATIALCGAGPSAPNLWMTGALSMGEPAEQAKRLSLSTGWEHLGLWSFPAPCEFSSTFY